MVMVTSKMKTTIGLKNIVTVTEQRCSICGRTKCKEHGYTDNYLETTTTYEEE